MPRLPRTILALTDSEQDALDAKFGEYMRRGIARKSEWDAAPDKSAADAQRVRGVYLQAKVCMLIIGLLAHAEEALDYGVAKAVIRNHMGDEFVDTIFDDAWKITWCRATGRNDFLAG